MWLLVSAICILTDPVTVDCRVEASRPVIAKSACLEMIRPQRALLDEMISEAGMRPVHVAVVCKRGIVG